MSDCVYAIMCVSEQVWYNIVITYYVMKCSDVCMRYAQPKGILDFTQGKKLKQKNNILQGTYAVVE